jgi:predicted amidohydrolase
MSDLAVACCQLGPRIGEPEHNRAQSAAAIEAAARAGAKVVVLPELCNSGYVFADGSEARRLAEPVRGPTVSSWAKLAGSLDVVVVGGFCELDPNDALHNSAVLVDRDGVRALYRKAHLWERESLVFTAGSDPPAVVDTAYGRIGVMVCYDLEFPEWVRLASLQEADLICAPVNWPAVPLPPGERPGEVVRVQAAASTNHVFVAACDRVGVERGVEWIGGSVIVDVDGFPVAGPAASGETMTLMARCNLDRARDKHLNEHNDVLADRRPELYGGLVDT